MLRNGRKSAGALALFLMAMSAGAAEINVPLLELATTGKMVDDAFTLGTHANAEISILGGYKFGGTLRFGFDASDVEKALAYAAAPPTVISVATVSPNDYNALVDRMRNSATLNFRLAEVLVREPFGAPLEFAYFIGTSDTFASGDEFTTRFGSNPIGSGFRGYSYFPNGIGDDPNKQYDGIHGVSGTGFSFALTAFDRFVPILYAYQDTAFGSSEVLGGGYEPVRGKYSSDIRVLLNGDKVKLEAFAGLTLPHGSTGLYRGGALLYFSTGTGADFMGQIGIPYWDPSETFGIDNVYLLFEPRVDFGFTSIIMTLFYHPAWYRQMDTGEHGVTDVNFKFLIGDLRETTMEGGFETTIGMLGTQTEGEAFRLALGPFFALVTEGVRWDLKFRVNPLRFAKPLEMFESFIGVRTAF